MCDSVNMLVDIEILLRTFVEWYQVFVHITLTNFGFFLSLIDEFLCSLYWVLFYFISFSDECMCSDNGMTYYTPISADGCANYMVYSDLSSASQGQVLNCPAGLLFDVCTCTCNYPQGMTCPSTCMRNTP